jgi:hypothetical protein
MNLEMEKNVNLNTVWVKAWNKEPQSMWTILKKKFQIFEKSLYIKKNC